MTPLQELNSVLCQLRDAPAPEPLYYTFETHWARHKKQMREGTSLLPRSLTQLDRDGDGHDYFMGSRVVFYRTTPELDLKGLQDAVAEQQRQRERDTAVDALGRLLERRRGS